MAFLRYNPDESNIIGIDMTPSLKTKIPIIEFPLDSLTKTTMAVEIEEYKNRFEVSYIESIVTWAADNDCDIMDVAKNLSPTLKEKLVMECHNKGLVKSVCIPETTLETLM